MYIYIYAHRLQRLLRQGDKAAGRISLSLSLYVDIYICVWLCVYVYICMCVYICVYIYIYICIYIYIYVCFCIYIYIYIYLYIYIYIYTYIYVYIHTHTDWRGRLQRRGWAPSSQLRSPPADACLGCVVSQEGASPTGLPSAPMVVQWANLPPG